MSSVMEKKAKIRSIANKTSSLHHSAISSSRRIRNYTFCCHPTVNPKPQTQSQSESLEKKSACITSLSQISSSTTSSLSSQNNARTEKCIPREHMGKIVGFYVNPPVGHKSAREHTQDVKSKHIACETNTEKQ